MKLFPVVMIGLFMLAAELWNFRRHARRLNEQLAESERQVIERQAH